MLDLLLMRSRSVPRVALPMRFRYTHIAPWEQRRVAAPALSTTQPSVGFFTYLRRTEEGVVMGRSA